MSMFELQNEQVNEEPVESNGIKDKIATFSSVRPRPNINLSEVDAVAAVHGFSSREPNKRRRRRQLPARVEMTRHLAIRCPESLYDRFVNYANSKGMFYHDALDFLLQQVEE